jgi:hypothetical protein
MATILSAANYSLTTANRFPRTAVALFLAGLLAAGCQGSLGNDVSRGPGGSAPPAAPGPTPSPAPPPVTSGPGPVAPPAVPPPVVPPPVAPPVIPEVPPPTETPPPVVMPPANPPATPPPAPPPAAPQPPVGEKRVVFVIGDVDNPSVGDDDITFLMQSQGFSVEVADDNDRSRDFRLAGLVVISSSANAQQLGNEWDTTQPVLVLDSDMFSRMGMTANGAAAGLQNARQIEIVDAKHPIASGRTGRITISDANEQLNFGAPGPAATIIATVNNDRRRAAIFAYEAGADLVRVGNAAAAKARNRRVGFFLRENGTESLRNDGASLFDAALNWTWNGGGTAGAPGAGAPTTPTPPANPGSGY